MKALKLYLGLMALFVVAGCAQTTRTEAVSYLDPSYRGEKYVSFIVEAQSARLGETLAIERTAAAQLQTLGHTASPASDLIPPTRPMSVAERRKAFTNTDAQAILIVRPVEKRIEEDYIPGSLHVGDYHGGFGFGTVYTPGTYYREPVARYEVTLSVLPDYRNMWQAEFSVRGPTGMSFDKVGASFAAQLVERLTQEGLI